MYQKRNLSNILTLAVAVCDICCGGVVDISVDTSFARIQIRSKQQ